MGCGRIRWGLARREVGIRGSPIAGGMTWRAVVVLLALSAASVAAANPAPIYSSTVLDTSAYALLVTPSLDGGFYRYDWDVIFLGTSLLGPTEYMDAFVVYDDDDDVLVSSGTGNSGWIATNPGGPGRVAEWDAYPSTNRIGVAGSITFYALFEDPLLDATKTAIHAQGTALLGGAAGYWIRGGTDDGGGGTEQSIPEAGAVALLATGIVPLAGLRWWRRK